jgi:hypothetical protein
MFLKKKIILLNIEKQKLKIQLVYYCFNFFTITLMNYSNCQSGQYKIVTKILKHSYILKWNSFISFVIEVQLNSVIEFFFSFNNLKVKNYKKLVYSKKLISLLRSPFVYKKTMEQLCYSSTGIVSQTKFIKYNYILQAYQYFFFNKVLNQNSILKFFLKIVFK